MTGCGARDGAAVEDAFDDLVRRHGESHRRYHTLDHVADVLAAVDRLVDGDVAGRVDGAAVRLAVWFHDAVYDPTASGNEAASADLAGEVLGRLGLPPAVVAEVDRLVRLTAGHEVSPGDTNGMVLADADLAVLGRDPDGYDAYVRAVRDEYGWLDDEAWAAGRRQVLEGFVRRERLYLTERARAAFEDRAGANLRRELAALAEPGGP